MLQSSKILNKSVLKLVSTQFKHLSSSFHDSLEWKNAKPYEDIPGFQNAFQIARAMAPGGKYHNLPLNKLTDYFKEDFGTLAKFPGFLGQRPMVMTFLPEDVEKVYRMEGKFPNRRPLDSIAYFRGKYRPDLYPAGAGLTSTQGEEWYNFRTKVQQVMMQPRATKHYVPGIDDVAQDFIIKIRKIRDASGETPDDFFDTINEWALESVGFIALDARLGVIENPDASNINKYVKHFFQATYDYDIQPSIWRYFKTPGFKKVLKLYEDMAIEVKKYVTAAVERYEKNPSEHEAGVLEKLLKIDKNIAQTMAEDMLVAGVDTTSTTLVSVLYSLAKNPEKQEILRKEVFKNLPDKDSKLNAKSFDSVPYLRAVIKEAMRVYPVTNGNVRALPEDIVLQGYRIPKDTDILLPNSHLSLLESQFKQSDKFIPERWLKDNTDPQCPHAKDAHPFSYMPFGFGTRMCIGRRFAELEVEVLVTRLLREFKIEWNQPELKIKSITLNLPDSPLKFKMIDIK